MNDSAVSGPVRIAVIAFALPKDNLVMAEATRKALAPIFPNRGISLIFCTFEEFDQRVKSGEAELVLGTSGAVRRLANFGLRPIATVVTPGGPDPNHNEGAAVVVRSDRKDLQTLGDLRSKTVAANNPLGFTGWQIVLGEVAKFGVEPEGFFGRTIFTGDARSLSDITKLVLDGKADAGILRLCGFERFITLHPEFSDELRVLDPRGSDAVACLHSTDLYPSFTMAVTEKISPELARQATLALLSMPATERGASWTVPTNFNAVDKLLEKLEIGPYEYLRETTINEFLQRYLPWVLFFFSMVAGLVLHGWISEVLVRRRGEQVEALMAEKMAQSEKLSAMQRTASLMQISSIFAHELRQPLTSASLYAEGLARQIRRGKTDPQKLAAIAQKVADETERASEIVDRVRAYAKGRRHERAVVDVADVMQGAMRLWRSQSAESIPCRLTLPASKMLVTADEFELELTFVNLLKNASEAAKRSDPAVSFSVREDQGRLVFEVADNGCRLSDEEIKTLSAGAGTPGMRSSTKPQGLGLGLGIVRSIIEAHGGVLAFGRNETEEDMTGLSVRVILPFSGSAVANSHCSEQHT